uniref:EGF-like domain-containing protein n=1 Tax=Anopheles quadriannulatus TaxID=34691 RepID=A0A182XLU5_ANOQN
MECAREHHWCMCEPGYTGKNCESGYIPCSPSPCQNGGTCKQSTKYSYECKCPPGTSILLHRVNPAEAPAGRRAINNQTITFIINNQPGCRELLAVASINFQEVDLGTLNLLERLALF